VVPLFFSATRFLFDAATEVPDVAPVGRPGLQLPKPYLFPLRRFEAAAGHEGKVGVGIGRFVCWRGCRTVVSTRKGIDIDTMRARSRGRFFSSPVSFEGLGTKYEV